MGCTSSKLALAEVEIDLNAKPSDKDRGLYGRADAVLSQCGDVLDSLANFESCAVPCREALGDPTPENRYRALEAVTQTAMLVYRYHAHSKGVCECAAEILQRIMSDVPAAKPKINPVRDIKYADHSALIMQLVQLFSFMFRFDNLKTYHGAIQNDLSMYRRMCQISKKSITEMAAGRGEAIGCAGAGGAPRVGLGLDETSEDYISRLYEWNRPPELDPDSVNTMSFFIASPIPAMSLAVKQFVKLAGEDTRVDVVFPHVINLFIVLASERRFGEASPQYLRLAEAITAAIIVTDRVEPEGVFNNRAQLDVSAAVNLLQRRPEIFVGDQSAKSPTTKNGDRGEAASVISERHTASRSGKITTDEYGRAGSLPEVNPDTGVPLHHMSVTEPGGGGKRKKPSGIQLPTSHFLTGIRYWTIHFEDATTLPDITRKLENV